MESRQRRLRSRPRDHYLARRLGGRSWLHLPVLVLLATVLFVWPGVANADRTGLAARSVHLPIINVVVIGDFYSYGYSASADAALRHSVPPTLQALNQIQAANPRVRIDVLFIPVADVVGGRLTRTAGHGKQRAESALIDVVRGANVVIDGLAVGNAKFASLMRTVLFDAGASSNTLLQLTSVFGTGAYLKAETSLLRDVATRMAPGSAIVTLGYPKVIPQRLSSGNLAWWSPFTGGTIGQQQASMSDQLASALNTANDQATSITGAKYPGLHLLSTDLSGAASGSAGGTATRSGQMIIGNELLPYLDQAVNDELAGRGIEGATNIRPVAPGSRWYLTVLLPGARVAHKPGRSGSSWSRRVGPKGRVTANSRVNTAPVRLPVRTPACALLPASRRPVGCSRSACGILCGGSGNGGRRSVIPGLGFPAPPGPLPRPIAPRQPPSAAPGQGTNPGASSGTSPSQSGSGSPAGSGSNSSPSGSGTSASGPSTTSSGPGTTSSGGATSGFGSPSGPSPSSGAGSYSGGGSSYGGGSNSGGGSSGGVS